MSAERSSQDRMPSVTSRSVVWMCTKHRSRDAASTTGASLRPPCLASPFGGWGGVVAVSALTKAARVRVTHGDVTPLSSSLSSSHDELDALLSPRQRLIPGVPAGPRTASGFGKGSSDRPVRCDVGKVVLVLVLGLVLLSSTSLSSHVCNVATNDLGWGGPASAGCRGQVSKESTKSVVNGMDVCAVNESSGARENRLHPRAKWSNNMSQRPIGLATHTSCTMMTNSVAVRWPVCTDGTRVARRLPT